jgi:hypothetical protein
MGVMDVFYASDMNRFEFWKNLSSRRTLIWNEVEKGEMGKKRNVIKETECIKSMAVG